jgi:nanoRNase/pAp phosphatase (c-di-AMP/oligoRNAs hydrolase)
MRLLTRSDFDGLICAVLLKEAGVMDSWSFVHPKDVQDGAVKVTENDILANVPYAPGCGLWFDHHASEQERLGRTFTFKGASQAAPSCARVIWDYYGGSAKFPRKYDEMLRYVDKCDSANLTADEVERPTGWVLLSFIMDPRTGLGRFQDFHISNYQLMERMIDWCRTMAVEEILALPDVKERVERYHAHDAVFREMLRQRAAAQGNVVVLDLRDRDEIPAGNRFLLYSMHPQCNVSVQVIWGKQRQNVVLTVGHSITNRTCKADVGSLMLKHGGGGHRQVGTCQVAADQADKVLGDVVAALRADG